MKVCEGVNEIHKDTKSIRKSVDKLNTKVDDITKRLEKLEDIVTVHDLDINDLKAKQESVDTEITTVKTMIESIEDHRRGNQEYDPEVIVVATNVPIQANENILEAANHLIENGLRIPALTAVRAMRLKSKNRFPGLVKIELPTVSDKISVLRNKQNPSDIREYKRVYLRSSKPHSERLADYNFRKLLQHIPDGNNFRMTANGRIINKTNPNPRLNQGVLHPRDQSHEACSGPVLPHNSSPNVSRIGTPISMISQTTQHGSHNSQYDRYHLSNDGY